MLGSKKNNQIQKKSLLQENQVQLKDILMEPFWR